MRDEAKPSERCVQPRTTLGIPQFPLSVLQLENMALIIVLKLESTLFRSYQMVFERRFENNAEEHCCISGDGGHRFWLQGFVQSFDHETKG